MKFSPAPRLALSPTNVLILALVSLLIYLFLFVLNLASTRQQLSELNRITAVREAAANLRASLTRFVLDDAKLGSRRGLNTAEIKSLKDTVENSTRYLFSDVNEMASYAGQHQQELTSIKKKLEQLSELSEQRVALLNQIYDSGGLVMQVISARAVADEAFTEISEAVPLPTRDYLAVKASQNEFLATLSPVLAAAAIQHLEAYKMAAERFPGLKPEQRRRLQSTGDTFLKAFTQVSAALLAAEDRREKIQAVWAELLPMIDQVSSFVTVQAVQEAQRVKARSDSIEIASAAMAILTALAFASIALSSYRLAMERDRRLRESNARFRDLARASSDIFMEVDARGRIQSLEGSQDTPTGELNMDFVGQDFNKSIDVFRVLPDVKTAILKAFTSRAPFREIEYRLTHPKTGAEIWHSMSGIPIFDSDGSYAGFRIALRDVTDRRRLIAERVLAEARLAAIIDNLPITFFRIEGTPENSKFTFVSDNVPMVMGTTPERMLNYSRRTTPARDTDDDRGLLTEQINKAFTSDKPSVTRARFKFPDGSRHWVQQVVQRVPVALPGGEVAIEGLWIDVTEEESRLQQLRDLEQAVNTSNLAFYISDFTTGEIFYYSKGCARLFGYPEDELVKGLLVGQSGTRIDGPVAELTAEINRDAVRPEGWRGEFTWRMRNGSIHHFLGHARMISDNRRIVVLTEISERVAQEKQLAAITTAVQHASDGVLIFSNTLGVITYANDAIRRMYRLPETADLVGRRIADFLPDRTAANDVYARGSRMIDESGAWQSQELGIRADGTPIALVIRGTRLPDGRVLVIMVDATERIQREAEERELRRRLNDAQRLEAIGSLAGGIAHDFNNIIGATRGFADLLVADLPEGDNKRFAERIVATCRRAAALVREIMAFSRIREEERHVIDVAALIHEAKDILVGRPMQNLRLEAEADSENYFVEGNQSQISQVITNLIVNAADATPLSGGVIKISAQRLSKAARPSPDEWHAPTRRTHSGRLVHVATQGSLDAARDYLCLKVADEGTGMTERVLGQIFEPFFTTKEKSRGTGLGLAVVASIVDSHGGAIRVETIAGAGTVFEIYLPLTNKAAVPQITAPALHGGDLRGSERILIVDDESDIAEALSIALGRLGYETAPIYNPQEALEIFMEDPQAWDLVISDQSMPKMRGVQLIRKMKMTRPSIRTIVCTGYSDALTSERAAEEGIDAFFHKPVTADTLASAIRRIFAAAPVH